jgi:hypothetical protein
MIGFIILSFVVIFTLAGLLLYEIVHTDISDNEIDEGY